MVKGLLMNLTEMEFFLQLSQHGIQISPEQKEAIRHIHGPLVVFAGPGSGKTTVLTCRAAYMLQVGGILPKELLIVTFTRAAAEEMRVRLSQLPGVGYLRAKACEIGTFHSVFLRILLRKLGSVPKLMGESEQKMLLRHALQETGADATEEEVADLLQKIGLCKNNLILPERIRVEKPENVKFRERFTIYEELKKEKSWWDYDDILVECHRLLKSDVQLLEEYRRRYRYILVDEFQDTNYAQYELIKLLAVHNNICIVGDDDQSIYRFRGSRVEYLLDFEKTFPGATKIILGANYRSHRQIIEASKRLIVHNRKRQQKDFRGMNGEGEKPRVIRPNDEKDEAEQILSEIEQGIKSSITPEQHAVLYRTNNQVRALIDVLVERQIPFTIYDSDSDFYRQWQVRDILSYMKLAQNPNDVDSLVQIINRPKRYLYETRWIDELYRISHSQSLSLVESLSKLQGLEVYQVKKLEQFIHDIERLKRMNPKEALRCIREDIGYEKYLREYADSTGNDFQRVMEPLDELAQAVQGYESISAFLEHVDRVQECVRQSRNSRRGIQLMTLHRAKGLEFHSVYIIGLVHHMMPHEKALGDQQTEEALEEERRLLYVGMTRAKERLCLSAPERYQGKKVKPSRFLYETGLLKSQWSVVQSKRKVEKEAHKQLEISPQERMKKAVERYGSFVVTKNMKLIHRDYGNCTLGDVQELTDGLGRRVTILIPERKEPQQLHLELSLYLGILKTVPQYERSSQEGSEYH
jgi:DNA helicase II / ATP-dependent DNA helicase PcrA